MLLFLLGCTADRSPCGIDARPASIDEVLDTIDALPSPVTLDCLLESLERPIGLELTSNIGSAQPAEGFRSPRIFVRTDQLTMSVVPVGEARTLLELGEAHTSGLTVKAELEFPIEVPLDRTAPFERILANPDADFTGCAVCHFEEIDVGDGRYASTPLRPPESMVVPLELLLEEHASCDPADDPERCSMYAALFDHGEVYTAPFPDRFVVLTPD